MPPFFSIVTTTRNCANDLPVTIASLRQQTSQDFEWVVQDGASSDGGLELIRDCGVNLSLVSERDDGIFEAMNDACIRSQGEWLICLQAGDWFVGFDALEKLKAQLINDDDCDIAVCEILEVDIYGHIHHRIPQDPVVKCAIAAADRLPYVSGHWLAGMPCHQGVAMRRKIFDHLLFDPSYSVCADITHLFQAIATGHRAKLIGMPLSWYPNGGNSHQKWDEGLRDIMRMCVALGSSNENVNAHFGAILDEQVRVKNTRAHDNEMVRSWLVPR